MNLADEAASFQIDQRCFGGAVGPSPDPVPSLARLFSKPCPGKNGQPGLGRAYAR